MHPSQTRLPRLGRECEIFEDEQFPIAHSPNKQSTTLIDLPSKTILSEKAKWANKSFVLNAGAWSPPVQQGMYVTEG